MFFSCPGHPQIQGAGAQAATTPAAAADAAAGARADAVVEAAGRDNQHRRGPSAPGQQRWDWEYQLTCVKPPAGALLFSCFGIALQYHTVVARGTWKWQIHIASGRKVWLT